MKPTRMLALTLLACAPAHAARTLTCENLVLYPDQFTQPIAMMSMHFKTAILRKEKTATTYADVRKLPTCDLCVQMTGDFAHLGVSVSIETRQMQAGRIVATINSSNNEGETAPKKRDIPCVLGN